MLVADDHPLMVEALSARMDLEPSISVVGSASRAEGVVEGYERLRPDVVLADVSMPGGGGIAALRAVLAREPTARFLFLSALDGPAVIGEAIAAGARGFVHKSAPTQELIRAVLAVAQGEVVLDAVASAGLAAAVRAERAAPPQLSEQERTVLALVADGQSNPSIAAVLNLSASTVKTYLDRVYNKLGVHDRAGAVALAKDLQII